MMLIKSALAIFLVLPTVSWGVSWGVITERGEGLCIADYLRGKTYDRDFNYFSLKGLGGCYEGLCWMYCKPQESNFYWMMKKTWYWCYTRPEERRKRITGPQGNYVWVGDFAVRCETDEDCNCTYCLDDCQMFPSRPENILDESIYHYNRTGINDPPYH